MREIQETLSNTYAHVARTIEGVEKLHRIYREGNQSVYCILSKESARNGSFRQPAVLWNSVKKGFVCPDCGSVIMMPVFENGASYMAKADQFYFQNETSRNHHCPHCDASLWSCLNPDDHRLRYNRWIRIGGYEYVYRRFASAHLGVAKDSKVKKQIREIMQPPNRYFPAVNAARRWPLSSYTKRRLSRIDAVIIDELHQYSGESAQGAAMAELAGIADKVVAMTATLLNGYAKGLFYLLYRLKSNLIRLERLDFSDSTEWCKKYGVVEEIYQVEYELYHASSHGKKRKVREKFLPGISPIVYSRFLLENTVFLSLADMGKELPDYEEIPLPCCMSHAVSKEYSRLESELKALMKGEPQISKKSSLHI